MLCFMGGYGRRNRQEAETARNQHGQGLRAAHRAKGLEDRSGYSEVPLQRLHDSPTIPGFFRLQDDFFFSSSL